MKYLKVGLMLIMASMSLSCASSVNSDGGESAVIEEPDKKEDKTVSIQASITEMSPLNGMSGTVLTISGSELTGVTYVCFNQTCVEPTSVEDTRLTVVVPDGQGKVYVSITKDGRALGAGKFTYLSESSNPLDVDWCQLSWVKPVVKSGEALEINAQVYEKGITGKHGTHEGIFAQVGYAELYEINPEKFKWYNATLNDSFAGEASINNDEYMTNKIILDEGRYRVAYRFSLDGYSWLYCDNSGSIDGFSLDDAGIVTVSSTPEEIKTLEWCRIVNGTTTITTKPDENSEMIYAQAYVPDCTGEPGHCESLQAQIGYGLVIYSSERSVNANYIWSNVSLNPDYKGTDGGEKYDEFMGSVKCSQSGSYAIVYRMTLDGGETWTYCDTLNDIVFNSTDGIRWTVSEQSGSTGTSDDKPTEDKKSIGWCRTQWPESITVEPGETTPAIYGRVYIDSCTGKESDKTKCPELKAQVGYGLESDDVSSYHYESAQLNEGYSESDSVVKDEYYASLKPEESGEYRVLYRFSLDNGKTWEYCDYDDAIGFKKENTVLMQVEPKPTLAADWCEFFPRDSVSVRPGSTADYYGQVHVPGCTEGEGACSGLQTWFGYGLSTDELSSFKFMEAGYHKEVGSNDEYKLTLQVPEETGEYDVVFAYSLNGGSKQYCGIDGSSSFKRENAGKLYVQKYSWGDGENQYKCGITEGSESYTASAGEEQIVYGQIYINGCTTANACCENVTGGGIIYIEGDDAAGENEILVEGSLNKEFEKGNTEASKNNDEYMTTMKLDKAGTYRYKYYFILKETSDDTQPQTVYCVSHWKSPMEVSDSDYGTAEIQP